MDRDEFKRICKHDKGHAIITTDDGTELVRYHIKPINSEYQLRMLEAIHNVNVKRIGSNAESMIRYEDILHVEYVEVSTPSEILKNKLSAEIRNLKRKKTELENKILELEKEYQNLK
jgi:hypothetical protein